MESRMRGDMQVRFGGRYEETYCRKAARRLVPSLRREAYSCPMLMLLLPLSLNSLRCDYKLLCKVMLFCDYGQVRKNYSYRDKFSPIHTFVCII